jgi:hypothetical protein
MQGRLSLARTAKLLVEAGSYSEEPTLAPVISADLSTAIETTDWGPAQRLNPPIIIDGTPMRWDHPARELGSAAPRWD